MRNIFAFNILHNLRCFIRGKDQSFNKATEQDLYYCYRLLLNREPDKGSWNYWQNLVRHHHVSLEAVVDGFLGGYEFQQIHAGRMQPELAELAGFKLYARRNDHFVGAVILREKGYEPHVATALTALLQSGYVFMDIGANIGYFSLLAASLIGPTGQVLAFEPKPDNQELLQMSMAANEFANITLYPYAVSDKAGTLFFTSGGGSDSNGRIVSTAEQLAWNTPLPQVTAVALDELLPELPRLDVVKMDIEGAEPLAYAGMRQLIQRHRPIIIIEFNPELIQTTSGLSPDDFLADLQTTYRLDTLTPLPERQKLPATSSEIAALLSHLSLSHLDLIAYPID